jgi:hypothetical protein
LVIKSESLFITKPFDVAKFFFYYYFFGKVGKLKQDMPTMNSVASYSCIIKIIIIIIIMEEKKRKFEFCKVSVGEVEKV